MQKKRKMKINKKRLLVFTSVLVLIIFIVYVGISSSNEKKSEKFYLKTAGVKSENISSTVFTSGKVASSKHRNLSFAISGKVENIFYDEGDYVKKGDIIADLDTEDLLKRIRSAEMNVLINQKNIDKLRLSGEINYETAYKNSEINYEVAKKNYNDNLELFNEGVISENQLGDFETVLKIQENEFISIKKKYEGYGNGIDLEILKLQLEESNNILQELENDLKNTKLVASMNGTITRKMVEKSDYIIENNTSFTVETIDSLIVKTEISQYDINDIEYGQDVLISRNGDEEEFKGVVSKISPIALESTQASVVPIEIEIKSENFYKPNYSVNVEITTSSSENAMVVPYESILKDDNNKNYIFKLEDGKAKKLYIEKGINGALLVEIITGELKTDDIVIVNPPKDLKDGSIVESLSDEL
jgi:multidrug efflux pump subunit AcrA (membrane-fusion protein)